MLQLPARGQPWCQVAERALLCRRKSGHLDRILLSASSSAHTGHLQRPFIEGYPAVKAAVVYAVLEPQHGALDPVPVLSLRTVTGAEAMQGTSLGRGTAQTRKEVPLQVQLHTVAARSRILELRRLPVTHI